MSLGGDRIYLKREGAELLNLKEGGKVKIAGLRIEKSCSRFNFKGLLIAMSHELRGVLEGGRDGFRSYAIRE